MLTLPLADVWMPSLHDLTYIHPILALVGTIVAVLLGALLVGRNWRVTASIAVLGALATAGLAARDFDTAGNWGGMVPAGSAPMLVVDQFSLFFIFLASVFLIGVSGLWWLGQGAGLPEKLARKQDAVEFFVLFLGSALGMALMVSTTNLLMIVLAVEMASLPSYALAGFRKSHRLAAEASVKYVLFGAITSATMVYGASLLYGRYQSLDVVRIGELVAADMAHGGLGVLTGVAVFGVLVGVAFKVSAVPFHFWCPDVFEGAGIEVTTWLSVASKAAGLGLMLRVLSAFAATQAAVYPLTQTLSVAIAVMAAITCTVGNFSAFKQTNLKRLLAFSSIAHAGYMLMAVAIIWYPTNGRADMVHPAFSAIAAYLIVYLFMNLGAFGIIAMVYWETGKETIDAFHGLIRRQPLLAICMAVCLFSLIGLPPLGGFIAKWWLLSALWDANLHWLVIVAVFNTLISLYYYVRIIRAMVMVDDGQPEVRAPLAGQGIALACAVAVLLMGTFWAGGLKRFTDARSLNLFAMGAAGSASAQAPTAAGGTVRPSNPTEIATADAASLAAGASK